MNTWRFINTGDMDGAANMAVDEALLHCYDPERSLPVFRLYGWKEPTLTLGRFQEGKGVLHLERCITAGIPVVRRITGGGVVFHAEELTYSLVCSPRHLEAAVSIKESFRILTRFLLHFYRKLGLSASHAQDCVLPAETVLGERTAFCFAGTEGFDIIIGGRKIGGNAQRRLRNVIFQHGSVPLRNHASEGSGFLREPCPGVGTTAAALEDFGITLPVKELQQLLAAVFSQSIPASLSPGGLTIEEHSMAAHLAGQNGGRLDAIGS